LVEILDVDGNLLRATEYQPLAGRAPTGSWQAGQFVRDQVNVVVPASAPPGQSTLGVRLNWLQPDGTKLEGQRWGVLPLDQGLDLGWLNVTEKEGHIVDRPDMQHTINANLAQKVRLIGYDTPLTASPVPETDFSLSRSGCSSLPTQGCPLSLDLYWLGISEMERLYHVFVHVVDSEGQIVAQHDGVPGLAKQPTTGWLAGEFVFDPVKVVLPPDLPQGRYTIRIGMYLPPDGPRLLVLDEATGQTIADAVEIGTLELQP
jgi:hypothetical protein